MRLVTGVEAALRRLGRIDIYPARREALEKAGARLGTTVRLSLSRAPGEDHATPWLRTGELRASIIHEATDDSVVIGSTDPVAIYQEMGTRAIPPRPFLAPAAAAEAEPTALEIAGTIRDAIEASR
jgi:phage gpG-like protein